MLHPGQPADLLVAVGTDRPYLDDHVALHVFVQFLDLLDVGPIVSRPGKSTLARRSFGDSANLCENVFLAKDQIVLVIDHDVVAGVLAE